MIFFFFTSTLPAPPGAYPYAGQPSATAYPPPPPPGSGYPAQPQQVVMAPQQQSTNQGLNTEDLLMFSKSIGI